ncbi:MAG: hypothetical protein ACOVN5_13120 [Aquidulcibacter sp.]|jgi:hypothetical protein
MSALPYCVVLPVSDNSDNDRVGIVITDIRCIKPDRTSPNKSVVFMHDPKVFHFIALTVEQVQDEINRVCDGDVE